MAERKALAPWVCAQTLTPCLSKKKTIFHIASPMTGACMLVAMTDIPPCCWRRLGMQHIPLKSTGDAVNEVLADRVQGVTAATIGVVGFR
jgi:hypothetical protein